MYSVSGVIARAFKPVLVHSRLGSKREAANLRRHTYEAPNPSELNPGTLWQYGGSTGAVV